MLTTMRKHKKLTSAPNLINKSLDLALSFLIAFICAAVIRTIIFEPYTIPSGSMKPNFMIGDYLVATKYDYGISKYSFWPWPINIINDRIMFRSPERGDVMIFRSASGSDTLYIKRVMALPGDKISVESGIVYINGKKLEQTFAGYFTDDNGLQIKKYVESTPSGRSYYILDHMGFNPEVGNMHEILVPEKSYFVMGDNRGNSNDSRVSLGLIPEDHITSKAKFILFSMGSKWWDIGHWLSTLDMNRFFLNVYSKPTQ